MNNEALAAARSRLRPTETLVRRLWVVQDTAPDEELAEIIPKRLYLSSGDGAANWEAVSGAGITHVVNCGVGIPNAFEGKATIAYTNIEMLDVPEFGIAPAVELFSMLMEAEAEAVVLVHCNAGVSRSATLVVSHLMRARGWTAEEALAHVRRTRPQAQPNPGFWKQLLQLQ